MTRYTCALTIVLSAATATLNAGTIVPNNELNIAGAGGTPVTTLAIGGGNSAAQDWLQGAIYPGSFLTSDLVASTDPFLPPPLRGNMMRITTDGFSPGGGAGNGISVTFIGDPVPAGSTGFIDIDIEVPGTFGELGFVENNGGTRFDPLGSFFFGGGQQTGWQRVSFSNPMQESGAFELEILFHPPGAAFGQVAIDHLAVEPASEPGSLLMAAGALVLCGCVGRRRQVGGAA